MRHEDRRPSLPQRAVSWIGCDSIPKVVGSDYDLSSSMHVKRPFANKNWKFVQEGYALVGSFEGGMPLHALAIGQKCIHEKRLPRFSWMGAKALLFNRMFLTRPSAP
jgi:hypothetical protein